MYIVKYCSPNTLQCRTYSTVSVEVRKTQHKYIVGPKGQGLQEVLQTTGVWVEVPSSDSDVNTITLRGPQEKLGQALTVVSLLCFWLWYSQVNAHAHTVWWVIFVGANSSDKSSKASRISLRDFNFHDCGTGHGVKS